MTLQQLEYVIALDQHRHFVNAAESCGITQSTLSSMLRKLEEELDIVIFDRNSHPIRPTKAGEAIIQQAKVVLYHSKQLMEMSMSERQKACGHINLGVTTTIAPTLMPKLFKYVSGLKDVTLTAKELYRDDIVRMLKRAELDMAIMSLPEQECDLLEIPLYKERLWAFVSPNDPLSQAESIDFSNMPHERLWALKHEICFQQQIAGLNCCEPIGNSKYESGDVATLLWIVEQNEGFTTVPELQIPLIREEHKHLVKPFVNPTPIRQVSLFVRNDYVRESLLNLMVQGIRQIIPVDMQDEMMQKDVIRI